MVVLHFFTSAILPSGDWNSYSCQRIPFTGALDPALVPNHMNGMRAAFTDGTSLDPYKLKLIITTDRNKSQQCLIQV